jgi:hypothetical protein
VLKNASAVAASWHKINLIEIVDKRHCQPPLPGS